MLIIIFLICLVVIILGGMFDCEGFIGVGLLGAGVVLLFGVISLTMIIDGRTLEEKIALYEKENIAIEQDINTLVEQYMNYEADAYENLKGESGITLVSLYPELKADELVKEQCELYIANKEQIASLKEQQIELSSWKFWLYFGK